MHSNHSHCSLLMMIVRKLFDEHDDDDDGDDGVDNDEDDNGLVKTSSQKLSKLHSTTAP